jgi:dsRNA-specific ribonuclease
MKKSQTLHNKTKTIEVSESPYNSLNILCSEKDLEELFEKEEMSGIINVQNINLYRNAFVHKSYCTMKNDDFTSGNENCPSDCLPLQEMSYERLEFLGDSILGMVVANYLHERYKEQNEGFLSKMRTKIVNGKMLGYLSNLIGFSKYVIISKQVENMGGRDNYKIMEDVFEAFVGAIFLDNQNGGGGVDGGVDGGGDNVESGVGVGAASTAKGYYCAEKWIIHIMEKYLDFSELIITKSNYKDMLSTHMQSYFQDSPKFFEQNVQVKNNTKVFVYVVKNKEGAILGTATGATKKEAENNASLEALKYYNVSI